MNKTVHLTKAGIEELQDELAKLKVRRVEVAKKLKEAKNLGDLSENSAWDEAQEEQKFVEARITEIERILQNAKVIASPKGGQEVQLGSTVHLHHDDHTKAYTVVGSVESNPAEGKISEDSPIGKAVLGKKVGDTVEIATPSGTDTYKITKVS